MNPASSVPETRPTIRLSQHFHPGARPSHDGALGVVRSGRWYLDRTQRRALQISAASRWVAVRTCGAVVAFEGIVRDHSDAGNGVTAIDYESHAGYAVARLTAVAEAARTRWPDLGRIVLWHRTGFVSLGEASVLVVVSAPHREAAFTAARFCIDVTKECVPVWNHEHRGGRVGSMSDGIDIDDVQQAAARWDARVRG
jgi:molybdopterin synthase catalytic subunit